MATILSTHHAIRPSSPALSSRSRSPRGRKAAASGHPLSSPKTVWTCSGAACGQRTHIWLGTRSNPRHRLNAHQNSPRQDIPALCCSKRSPQTKAGVGDVLKNTLKTVEAAFSRRACKARLRTEKQILGPRKVMARTSSDLVRKAQWFQPPASEDLLRSSVGSLQDHVGF